MRLPPVRAHIERPRDGHWLWAPSTEDFAPLPQTRTCDDVPMPTSAQVLALLDDGHVRLRDVFEPMAVASKGRQCRMREETSPSGGEVSPDIPNRRQGTPPL